MWNVSLLACSACSIATLGSQRLAPSLTLTSVEVTLSECSPSQADCPLQDHGGKNCNHRLTRFAYSQIEAYSRSNVAFARRTCKTMATRNKQPSASVVPFPRTLTRRHHASMVNLFFASASSTRLRIPILHSNRGLCERNSNV